MQATQSQNLVAGLKEGADVATPASLLHLHKSKSGVFSAQDLLHSITCITEL